MAEILFCVRDEHPSADPHTDAQRFKPGDVITLTRNNQAWGRDEVTRSAWRILCLPLLAVTDLALLMVPEAKSSAFPDAPLQLRGYRLDLEAFPAEMADYLTDDARNLQRYTMQMTAEQFAPLIVKKQRLPAP